MAWAAAEFTLLKIPYHTLHARPCMEVQLEQQQAKYSVAEDHVHMCIVVPRPHVF